MAFIPGETGGVLVGVTSGTGSGILTSTNFGGIASLSSALVAGTNVAITPDPAFGGKGLRIDATPGTAGVNSLTAGTGIDLSGTAINPIVNNTGVLSVSTTGSGSGITIGGTPQNPQFSNAGVLGVNSNQGQVTIASSGGTIAITNPTPGTINIEQSGGGGTLTGITAGDGISVTGTAPSPTVTNTGVLGVYGGIGIVIAGASSSPTVNASGVLNVYSGKGVVANYINAPNTQTVSLNYRPDQAFVENPNFTLLDRNNNGFVDSRGAPLNSILIQYPGTYYIRATDYSTPGDLQAWALIQTGTTPASGAITTPSGGIYTIFNANPIGGNNISNLNFSWLRDNTFSPGLTSPLAGSVQLSPNQSVSFMVNYLPSQGAGGTAGSTTQPVITWLQKNSVSGVPY